MSLQSHIFLHFCLKKVPEKKTISATHFHTEHQPRNQRPVNQDADAELRQSLVLTGPLSSMWTSSPSKNHPDRASSEVDLSPVASWKDHSGRI